MDLTVLPAHPTFIR